MLHLWLGMQADCSKSVPCDQVLSKGVCGSACLTPPPVRLLPCPILFFLRHKHKMELAESKNNLSKMAECSRECQAIKQRERAPPAVQQKDPNFLSSLFLYMLIESIQANFVMNLDLC